MPRESDWQDESPEEWDFDDAADWSSQRDVMTPPPELSPEEQRRRQRMPWIILGILILLAVIVTYAKCAGGRQPSMSTLRGVYDLVPAGSVRRGEDAAPFVRGREGPCRLVMELRRWGRGRFLWSGGPEIDPLQDPTGETAFEWKLDEDGKLHLFNGAGGVPHECFVFLAWHYRIVMDGDHVTLYGERTLPQLGHPAGTFLRRTGR